MLFSIITEFCNNYHNLTLKHFIALKRSLCPLAIIAPHTFQLAQALDSH